MIRSTVACLQATVDLGSPGSLNDGMESTMKVLGWIEALLLQFAAVAMIVITGIVCYGILARSFHWPSLPDDILIVRQLMLMAIAAALGFATAERAHIAIDIFYNALSAPLRKACNLLAFAMGLVAFLPLTYWAWGEFTSAFANGDYMYGKLKLPVWPGEGMFFLGLLVMMLRIVTLLFQDAMRQGPFDDTPREVE